VRSKALTHVASAVARTGDLPRATAVVRMIGNQSSEDGAFAAVAKDLAAHDRFDDAVAVHGHDRPYAGEGRVPGGGG